MLTFEEAKKFLETFPKKDRWVVMGILYDNGIIEQKEYSNEEIANLLGISRIAVYKILKSALNKLNKNKIAKELYYE